MASRTTRTSVRTSKPAQQHLNSSFVSGGSVQPNNRPVVTYPTAAPAAPQPPVGQNNSPLVTIPTTPQQPKMEMKDADGDVTMGTADAAADVDLDLERLRAEKRKFFQGLKKVTGVRKKPNKQLVQRRLRKHLTPKNATMALQEVCPGSTYHFSLMPGSSPAMFTAEVEVDGKQYTGTGSNKSLARAAAAERALQSFVRPNTAKTDDQGKETVEDTTPWSALAGFALHKLFCDWRQGRVGAPLSVEAAGPPPAEVAAANAVEAAATAAAFKNDTPASGAFQSFTVPKLQTGEHKEKKAKAPKPPKTLPSDAVTRHPVMLLHEMRPTATFDVTEQVMEQPGGTQGPSITVTVTVDDQVFKGTGRTKKLAKRVAAKVTNTAIFDLQYPAEME